MPQAAEKTGHAGALTDRFRRTIDYLRVSVTDRCNLRCVYCMPKDPVPLYDHSELLTMNELVRIIRAARARGVRKVRLTGGEPLLRPDIIPMIAAIKQGVGIRDLSLTTNGMLLPGMAFKLKAAGLDRVNISLDTLDPLRFRRITRGGDIDRVREAIEAAEKAGLSPIKINMVVIRGVNEDELPEFARLTRDRDMHVRFIELMPAGRTGWKRDDCVPSSEIRARIAGLGTLVPLEFRGKGPSRNCRVSGWRGVIGFISPVSDHFCGCCNRLRLTATGVLRPCLFSAAGVDLKGPLRAGADDQALAALLELAAASKPAGHALSAGQTAGSGLHGMMQIGG